METVDVCLDSKMKTVAVFDGIGASLRPVCVELKYGQVSFLVTDNPS